MSNPRLPVIWICGAAGAGKSAAAWGLFEELAAAGKRVAYIDIDQLGMLYPEVDDDPGWHHAVKGEALATLMPGYATAGAQLLIVSGVINPHEGPRTHLPPNTDLTLCLLSPDPAVLRRRILERGWGPGRRRRGGGRECMVAIGDVHGYSNRDDGTIGGGDGCAATRLRTLR